MEYIQREEVCCCSSRTFKLPSLFFDSLPLFSLYSMLPRFTWFDWLSVSLFGNVGLLFLWWWKLLLFLFSGRNQKVTSKKSDFVVGTKCSWGNDISRLGIIPDLSLVQLNQYLDGSLSNIIWWLFKQLNQKCLELTIQLNVFMLKVLIFEVFDDEFEDNFSQLFILTIKQFHHEWKASVWLN